MPKLTERPKRLLFPGLPVRGLQYVQSGMGAPCALRQLHSIPARLPLHGAEQAVCPLPPGHLQDLKTTIWLPSAFLVL